MRLWSIHPRHLDARGLVALWREGLLARAVLRGQTRGYRRHPQLDRFRECLTPIVAIDRYLGAVLRDAEQRGYRFDASKIAPHLEAEAVLVVTRGQLEFERSHLLAKLQARDPERWLVERERPFDPHPSFRVEEGDVQSWERVRRSVERAEDRMDRQFVAALAAPGAGLCGGAVSSAPLAIPRAPARALCR